MRKITLPAWVAACLALLVFSMFAFTVSSAIQGYTLIKPFVVEIITQPSKLTIESVSFEYNASVNRYASCNVTVNNTATASFSGSVTVQLIDAAKVNIAFGQQTMQFQSGLTTLQVPLVWVENKTASDVAGGYIIAS
ncbi:MAG: hypothetical protein ACPL4I_11395 [Bacteroidota bacterium]